MNEGLYRTKPAGQRLVAPLVEACLSRGISADVVTLAAIPVAAMGGICLALSDGAPVLLLAVPFLAAARLVLNLIDGQVARRSGSAHPWGEVLNEMGDRIADVLFIGGLAFVAAVGPLLALAGVVAGLLASYAGITARAAGVTRQYGGIMSKPGRMVALAVGAPVAFLLDEGWPLLVAAWVILVGSLLTLAERLRSTHRALADIDEGTGGEPA